MSKRVTRRQMKSWLGPIRACFVQIRSGEVDSIRGYAMTRLNDQDEYARIDYCIAGFRGLLDRLCPGIDVSALERIEKKLAAGTPLTVAEIDAAFSLLRRCEDALIRKTVSELREARITEEIRIELDALQEAA